jgi:putative ABC transport system permease protein
MNPLVFLKTVIVWLLIAFYAGVIGFMVFAALTGPVKMGYNLRNVLVRWRATLATVLGIALVVAVYVLVQALGVGIEKSSGNTGDSRNLMVVRKGSTAESSSLITREQVKALEYAPEIARNEQGQSLMTADVLVIMNLPRNAPHSGEANVLLRGVSVRGRELRPQVQLVEGRWFEPGKREVVVSRRLANRFANFKIGDSFKTGPRP